jgi:hypothetical protein
MSLQFIADDPWQILWLLPAIAFFVTMIYISRGLFLLMIGIPFALACALAFVGPRLVGPLQDLGTEFTRHPYEPDLIKWAVGLSTLAGVYLWAQRRWPAETN